MPHISEFLEAIQYNIANISEYAWSCYGTDSVCVDSTKDGCYDTSANFCTKTKEIREVTLYDYSINKSYRWTDPEYAFARQLESMKKNVNDKIAYGVVEFVDVDVIEDILEKIQDIYNGIQYDERVIIPLDISDKDFLQFAKAAHALDITFNEFVEVSIKEAIKNQS